MDDLGMSGIDVSSVVSSGVNALVMVIVWLLVIVVVGAVIGFAYWLYMHKHKVRVRQIVKGRSMVIDDSAREWRDRDGAIWWKFLKTKLKVTPPPVESLDISKKGKIIAEGYWLDNDQFIWRSNDFDYEHLKTTKAEFVKDGYDALTSQERALYAKELRDSEKYKKKKVSELLAAIAPYVAIIMIFALFLIFFNEVVAPAKELGAEIKSASGELKQAMIIVKDVVQNRETLWLEQQTNSGVVAPN